jgi:hypothetical protein
MQQQWRLPGHTCTTNSPTDTTYTTHSTSSDTTSNTSNTSGTPFAGTPWPNFGHIEKC